ncbi:MAG: adenosine deaminase [Betaproteobacteria bacterium]
MPAKELIRRMPKAELHMHLEGSLEPDLMFRLARRNGIALPYASQADLKAAYRFTGLQSFLDVYYAGLTVLLEEQDFFDMTRAYLERAHADNVVHAEVFVSPQAHTRRGVPLGTVVEGIDAALMSAGRDFGMTARLILGIQRQWDESDAIAMIDAARAWRDRVAGIGMGGPELAHPPHKFVRAFAHARELGWRTMAHAGEEGPASYVADTLDLLKVDRIDHGVRCEEDPALVARLAERQVPLTVCPVSNVKLHVFPDLAAHNIKRLLDAGLCVTMNSDDPSYFLGYVNDNFEGCEAALGLTRNDLYKLARNSFTASFLKEEEKQRHISKLDAVFNS